MFIKIQKVCKIGNDTFRKYTVWGTFESSFRSDVARERTTTTTATTATATPNTTTIK
jgi:hypothetical protein